MPDLIEESASNAARRLLAAGAAADPWTRANGAIEAAIPVEQPKGKLRSWFVPVTRGEALVGFFELSPSLEMMRYSTFQRRPGSLDGCPPKSEWIDPLIIARTAQPLCRAGEQPGSPYLSFDQFPSRLAWAVPCLDGGRQVRTIFVAGKSAYEGYAD